MVQLGSQKYRMTLNFLLSSCLPYSQIWLNLPMCMITTLDTLQNSPINMGTPK
jgi:hypothetical protein